MSVWTSHTIERQDTIIADTRMRLERRCSTRAS
jgi:hypothetical protein